LSALRCEGEGMCAGRFVSFDYQYILLSRSFRASFCWAVHSSDKGEKGVVVEKKPACLVLEWVEIAKKILFLLDPSVCVFVLFFPSLSLNESYYEGGRIESQKNSGRACKRSSLISECRHACAVIHMSASTNHQPEGQQTKREGEGTAQRRERGVGWKRQPRLSLSCQEKSRQNESKTKREEKKRVRVGETKSIDCLSCMHALLYACQGRILTDPINSCIFQSIHGPFSPFLPVLGLFVPAVLQHIFDLSLKDLSQRIYSLFHSLFRSACGYVL